MKEEQVEEIAVTLHELDRQRGLRSQRWAAGSEAKRRRYRERARSVLAREGFCQAKSRLERQFWLAGQIIAEGHDLTRLPKTVPSRARH